MNGSRFESSPVWRRAGLAAAALAALAVLSSLLVAQREPGVRYERPDAQRLGTVALEWIRDRGARSLLDQLHNFIGHAPEAWVGPENAHLFRALGFETREGAISRRAIHEVFGEGDFAFTLSAIRSAVLERGAAFGMDEETRWFFDWAFSTTPDMKRGLVRPGVVVVGWNDLKWSRHEERRPWVSFGAYLCTVALARGGDGAWMASHYDTYPVNPRQVAALARFGEAHGGLDRIYLVNERPEHLEIIGERWPEARVFVASKTETEIWFLEFRIREGEVTGRYSSRPASEPWLASLRPAGEPIDYRRSQLSAILPRRPEFRKPIVFSPVPQRDSVRQSGTASAGGPVS